MHAHVCQMPSCGIWKSSDTLRCYPDGHTFQTVSRRFFVVFRRSERITGRHTLSGVTRFRRHPQAWFLKKTSGDRLMLPDDLGQPSGDRLMHPDCLGTCGPPCSIPLAHMVGTAGRRAPMDGTPLRQCGFLGVRLETV